MPRTFYFDTEFIEGPASPKGWRGRVLRWLHRHGLVQLPRTIQLVSIGIVSDDGREYYAVNRDFNPDDADEWVRKNVLPILPMRSTSYYDSPNIRNQELMWRSNKRIAQDIIDFVFTVEYLVDAIKKDFTWIKLEAIDNKTAKGANFIFSKTELVNWAINFEVDITPRFCAYYADYDWVVFCQALFGKMNDLPAGFPKYCYDLKQEMDRKGVTVEAKRALCPDPEGEHDALVDARWNKRFAEFLESVTVH